MRSHWVESSLLRMAVVVRVGKEDGEKASLSHPGKKTERAPTATKYRVSRKQYTFRGGSRALWKQ